MLVGGHVSIAEEFKAVPRAAEQGFNLIQIFVVLPVRFKRLFILTRKLPSLTASTKKIICRDFSFTRCIWLIWRVRKIVYGISQQSLIEYLRFGEQIGCTGTIFHIGSYKNSG